MTQYETLSLIIQGVILLVLAGALGCAIYGLRPTVKQVGLMLESLETQKKTRFAELIAHLAERWESKPLAESRAAVRQTGSSANLYSEIKDAYNNLSKSERLITLIAAANFFDTMGVLVKLGYLDIQTAKAIYGEAAESYYAMYRETLESTEFRRFLVGFPYLVNELRKKVKKKKKK